MSAPRTSSMRALRHLAAGSRQVRQLHMTGAASSSRLLTTEKPAASAMKKAAAAKSKSENRTFNTSRTMKSPKDTSTIDFAFLPDAESMTTIDEIRVPLVPTNYSPPRTGAHAPLVEETVIHRPTIVTASGSATFVSAPSALADVHDNTGTPIDFHSVSESLGSTAKKISSTITNETQAAGSTLKQLWAGVVDDVFGSKPRVAS